METTVEGDNFKSISNATSAVRLKSTATLNIKQSWVGIRPTNNSTTVSLDLAHGEITKGAQHLTAESSLCRITCEDKTQYFIPCGIKCLLLETNDNLKRDPTILSEKPSSDGFIAIVLPKLKDFNVEMNKLLSKDDYLSNIESKIT